MTDITDKERLAIHQYRQAVEAVGRTAKMLSQATGVYVDAQREHDKALGLAEDRERELFTVLVGYARPTTRHVTFDAMRERSEQKHA